MGWTWYLPNDMQFFLISPPLIWLFYHHRKIGIIALASIQAMCFAACLAILAIYDFSPSYFRAKDNYFQVYYSKPYNRIFPYFIGLLSSLVLYSFKNETREQSVFKRFGDYIDKTKWFRFFLYIGGMAIMATFVFTFYSINRYPDDFGLAFNILYLTFSRGLFILGLTMVLMPVLMGHGSVIRNVMSLDIFTPMARLTFGAYMVHPIY